MTVAAHTQLIRLLLLAGTGALVLCTPAAAAEAPLGTTGSGSQTGTGGNAGTNAPEAPATSAPTVTVEPSPPPPPAAAKRRAPQAASPPHVHAQHAQGVTRAAPVGAPAKPRKRPASKPAPQARHRGARRAPRPSSITPPLPLAFSASLAGIPTFFIESFRIPPFLLPIFQAAGTAYGVPWQILAAINEVETDYGRDLSVSSAGAEGWMQFLPASWAIYGVDANGDGFKDPYNPADAVFAAARFLRAAGAATDLRGAIYAYNHSQAYVETVLLRARLLGGTPQELLGALAGLTAARFPVHAPSHFSDGFAPAPAGGGRTIPGTTIYSHAGAPVIAVQDGQIVRIGDTRELGRFVTLRDAYGNTYTYAELGRIARFYPVLEPHESAHASSTRARPQETAEAAPTGPATAGVQPRVQTPLEEGPAIAGLGAAPLGGGLGSAVAPAPPASAAPAHPAVTHAATPAPSTPSAFRAGPNDVYLHPLRAGVRVIAGTVLGHLTAADGGEGPHTLFQIRPAGEGAPLIDPKPILDGWVQLENAQVTRAGGAAGYQSGEPSPGQVLLESKQQLQQQLLASREIHLQRCARQDAQTGGVDRRVLAAIEFLAASGLRASVSGLPCAVGGEAKPLPAGGGEAFDIAAVDGVPVAGHQGPGSITDTTIRKLLSLQGPLKPRQIISLTRYPGASSTVARRAYADRIHVSFAAPPSARIAQGFATAITPTQWIQLIARLGEIPSPVVRSGPSAASIPDQPTSTGVAGGNG